jgi:site-specific DNA-methyltransferase (adenine-specific)
MELYRDHFQNHKRYNIPPAQLIIADIPYNCGADAYGSNPQWYVGGDNKNGESEFAGKQFFDTDEDFRISEFLNFAGRMLKKEPKNRGEAGCMIVFCSFEQQFELIQKAPQYGWKNYINLVFVKDYSPQVLKANMRVVGNSEYAVLLYRDRLPKFRNEGRMVFNAQPYQRDTITPSVHPTQKSIYVISNLIRTFTDPGDVVIDPCAGSGVTLLAAEQLGRKAYGFEIKREFVDAFNNVISRNVQSTLL